MQTRHQVLADIKTRKFDLAVIGGGIVGAGVAHDAASRGLSTILVERDDFSSGTSSRTTKLIHGGLRYLEQGHIKLTRELCQERELLRHLAPHMVRDCSFILPLSANHPLLSIKSSIGLAVYDLLSINVHSAPRHSRISRAATLKAAPALAAADVSGALRFHDCLTDDSRLVLEVIKQSCREGASAINYLEATDFVTADHEPIGIQCRDRLTGDVITINATACVNATGIWSDEILRKLDRCWQTHVAPSKGVHIMVAPSAFPTDSALLLPTHDKRYVFVVPWQSALMIGTTDRPYQGPLDNPLPDQAEIDYLLAVVNRYAGSRKLKRSDIIGSFAGLRPLVQGEPGAPTSNLSREHIIFDGPRGIISLTGGKLTNFRIMAEKAVDKVLSRLPDKRHRASGTRDIMLGGWQSKDDFLHESSMLSASARELSLEPDTIDHLLASYGKDTAAVLDIARQDPSLRLRICHDFAPIMAEVLYCVDQEMAVSLEDLLLRRLRLGILDHAQCLKAATPVGELMGSALCWDQNRTAQEIQTLVRHLEDQLNLIHGVHVPT